VLRNGFVIVGVQPFWQQVAVGAVLIAAVYFDQLRRSALRAMIGTTHTEEEGNAHHTTASRQAGGPGRGARDRLPRRRPPAATTTAAGGGGELGGGKKMTLLAGVKGDEFYITMNCGAQAEAKKLGVSLDFQGPDQFDPSLQTPIANASRGQEARRAARRADRLEGDVRADQADLDAGSKVVLVDTTLDQSDFASRRSPPTTRAAAARRPRRWPS
jgi:hypothetical protein